MSGLAYPVHAKNINGFTDYLLFVIKYYYMLESIILGLLQGITEFLPVSSSGHLLYAGTVFMHQSYNLPLVISAHVGTMLALLIFFRRRIKRMVLAVLQFKNNEYSYEWKLWYYLIVASIPAALAGLFLESRIEKISGIYLLGFCWIINGLILIIGEIMSRQRKESPVNVFSSLIIGIFQAIAILPGISRSGSTITAARNTGLNSEAAFEFSFLLGIIAISGGFLLEIVKKPSGFTHLCLVSGITAMIFGYFSLIVLLKAIRSNKMKLFGIYTIISGIVAILKQI